MNADRSVSLRTLMVVFLVLWGAFVLTSIAQAQTINYTYDTGCAYCVGRLRSVTDSSGSTTVTYDERGRQTRVDKVVNGTTYTTQSTYDTLDRVVTMTYPDGEAVSHTYNGQGLLERLNSTTDYVSDFNYNAVDKVTWKWAGDGRTTTYTYDPNNFRLTNLATPGLQNLTYAYDNVGNITGITDTIKAGTQSFSYDNLDRLTSASSGASPNYNHAYTYNTIGNMTGMTQTGSGGGQFVDPATGVGGYTSIKLDSSGNPHISYYDWTNSDLKYAKWTGSSWSIQTVESNAGIVGRYTSLALDSAGNPHIAYHHSANTDLKYAKWNGSTWDIQIVLGFDANWISLALDNAGNAHMSYYYTNGNDDLRYSKWTGTTWDNQIVDTAGNVGLYTSIALDISGNPHISYTVANGGLKYVKKTGTTWGAPVIVDNTVITTGTTSIALDSSGNPHIVYSDATNARLKYAKWNGTSWEFQIVDGVSPFYKSMVLDLQNRPHIAYAVDGAGDLKYAKWTGSSWDIQVLDSAGTVGYYNSLTLDISGNPHISYSDDTNSRLKYYKIIGGGAPVAFTYPAAGSARPHAPTSDGTCSYGYDANGNLTSRVCGSVTRAFTWDYDNRLTQVADNGATLATFAYDYAGARVKKVEGSNTTLYPFGHYKVVNGTTVTKYYFANGQRVAERDSTNATYYYHPDHLGSSNIVANSAGAEVKATLFYPYGSTRYEAGTKEIIHKYTGKELDSSTGLYDYGARYYDPAFMHFITADSIVPSYADPQSLNHYSYVRNNPIRLIDPTGHEPRDFTHWGPPQGGLDHPIISTGSPTRTGIFSEAFSETFGLWVGAQVSINPLKPGLGLGPIGGNIDLGKRLPDWATKYAAEVTLKAGVDVGAAGDPYATTGKVVGLVNARVGGLKFQGGVAGQLSSEGLGWFGEDFGHSLSYSANWSAYRASLREDIGSDVPRLQTYYAHPLQNISSSINTTQGIVEVPGPGVKLGPFSANLGVFKFNLPNFDKYYLGGYGSYILSRPPNTDSFGIIPQKKWERRPGREVYQERQLEGVLK